MQLLACVRLLGPVPQEVEVLCMVQVIGAFVQLDHWLPLMLDAVTAPQASLTTRVNALVVLAAMLYASGELTATAAVSNLPCDKCVYVVQRYVPCLCVSCWLCRCCSSGHQQ